MELQDGISRSEEASARVKPEYYLSRAKEFLKKGKPHFAIQYYIQYIQNMENPLEIKLIEQVNLSKLIIQHCNRPSGTLLSGNVILFLAVLKIYPENAVLWNALGVFVFSQGKYALAQNYFKKAADAGFLPGEKNFLHVIWHVIPRWHFRMLNDKKRNEAYRKAIDRAVKQGFMNVYDIGTGCGLLSLIAAKSHEDVTVTAFEENKTLCDIASNIFKQNNVSEKITLKRINSNLLDKAPSSCNLIITEIFDAGVFGEDCLKSITHALTNFVGEKFKIIPASVVLFVTGFNSNQVSGGYRLMNSLPELKLGDRCLRDANPEPYDSEFLKNKNVKYLTETQSFLNLAFNNLEQLNKIQTDVTLSVVDLVCTESGTVHALAVWFELNLDEDTKINTHPENPDNLCWEQAVYHLDHPVNLEAGSTLKLQPYIEEGRIKFQVLSPLTSCVCFPVNKEFLRFLNDSKLVEEIKLAADNCTKCESVILDLNIFPLFGFLMAKKGATLYLVYKDECDLLIFNYIIKINDLDGNEIVFIPENELEDCLFCLESPNIVFRRLIRSDGSWNPDEFNLAIEPRWNREILPKKIFLNAQLISSRYLEYCNKVDDGNVFDFKIFLEMNKYSGTEHPHLDYLEHEKHSNIVSFDISDFDKIDFHAEGKITEDGNCNGILYWFDIQFSDDETNKFSTLDSSYYDKCCSLLNNPKVVENDQTIMFHILSYEGHLKVYCD